MKSIDVLAVLGTAAHPSLKVLLRMLTDGSQFALYDHIISCFFRLGQIGISALIEEASDATSEWDCLIL